MFVYKEVTSNNIIILSSSIVTFLMYLEKVVEFLALLLSSLSSFQNGTYVFAETVQYLKHIGPIRRIGTTGFCMITGKITTYASDFNFYKALPLSLEF